MGSRLNIHHQRHYSQIGKTVTTRVLLLILALGLATHLAFTLGGAEATNSDLRSTGPGFPGPDRPTEMGKSAPAGPAATITFDQLANIIQVEGPSAVVTLTDIHDALGKDNQALERLTPHEWYLKANLLIGREVKLLLHGQKAGGDVDWLKLKSDSSGFVWVKTWDGQISINATRVTSWDLEQETFDTTFYGLESYERIRGLDESALDPNYGRAFVLARARILGASQPRMDINNSEMAYLGFAYWQMQGVAWRTPKRIPIDVGGVTGVVTGSRFHHNYFGGYTFRAVDMIWRGNEFYSNAVYGFDPHDDSQRFLVEGNSFYSNGSHGLIFSVRCTDNVIRGNKSFDNKGHGIVLDIDSDDNLVEGNEVFGNNTGIVLHSSDNNVIQRNTIRNNNRGIRIDTKTVSPAQLRQPEKNGGYASINNLISGNVIEDNLSFAIYSYPPSDYNLFENNLASGNRVNGFYRARPDLRGWEMLATIWGVATAVVGVGALILPYIVYGRRSDHKRRASTPETAGEKVGVERSGGWNQLR